MTGKKQALEILKDRQPHSHRELYFKLRGNPNVISKLRRDGYLITTERRDGDWWYQLRGRDALGRPEPAPLLNGQTPVVTEDQLSLEDVL